MIIFKETEIMYMISYHISYIYMNERSIVGRDIQLTKDYTTGNETFKQESRGTVIEATSRKDRKLKVKFNNDTKKYRLIKGCDLQLYEGVAFSPNSWITDRGRLFWILK